MKVVSESVAALTPDERRAAADKIKAHGPFGMRHMGRAEDFSAGSDMVQRLSPFNKLRVRE